MNDPFMKYAIDLALRSIEKEQGGPFGAVVVRDGAIIGEGYNQVTRTNDPSAHAEINAIRHACQTIQDFNLAGCVLYTSCEPCPMCLGAIYWSRLDRVYYGATCHDAAEIGFDDAFIYEELERDIHNRARPFEQICQKEALEIFKRWTEKADKIPY